MTKQTILNDAVKIVAGGIADRLKRAWLLGECYDRLIRLHNKKSANGMPDINTPFNALSKVIKHETGEDYARSTWLNWRAFYLLVSKNQLLVLMGFSISFHVDSHVIGGWGTD